MSERPDGRRPDQLRPVRIIPDFLVHAEGSVLVETGLTRVVCTVSLEDKVPQFLRGSGKGWLTSEYGMLPRSTGTRMVREVTKGRASGRTQEIQRLIGRALRSVVDLEALGERTLLIDCDVIQADGGTRTASITGAFVALGLALDKLRRDGLLERPVLSDYLAAVSVGIVGGTPLLDLNYEEDVAAEVDMNVVMTGQGRFVEVQGTAEKTPFTRSRLDHLLDLGWSGIRSLVEVQRTVLSERWDEASVLLVKHDFAGTAGQP